MVQLSGTFKRNSINLFTYNQLIFEENIVVVYMYMSIPGHTVAHTINNKVPKEEKQKRR